MGTHRRVPLARYAFARGSDGNAASRASLGTTFGRAQKSLAVWVGDRFFTGSVGAFLLRGGCESALGGDISHMNCLYSDCNEKKTCGCGGFMQD